METPSALFHKLFLFIGSLHNFKIGHTNGWLPCHGTLRDSQSFLDVSTPSTLEQSFCLFNGENSAQVRPLFALYCTALLTGEIVSFNPDHAFHQSLPSFVKVTNDRFISEADLITLLTGQHNTSSVTLALRRRKCD